MSMKTKAAILVTSFAVLLFVVVGSLGGVHASSSDGSYRQLQVYSEVLSRVRSEYVVDPTFPRSPTEPCTGCSSRWIPIPAT